MLNKINFKTLNIKMEQLKTPEWKSFVRNYLDINFNLKKLTSRNMKALQQFESIFLSTGDDGNFIREDDGNLAVNEGFTEEAFKI